MKAFNICTYFCGIFAERKSFTLSFLRWRGFLCSWKRVENLSKIALLLKNITHKKVSLAHLGFWEKCNQCWIGKENTFWFNYRNIGKFTKLKIQISNTRNFFIKSNSSMKRWQKIISFMVHSAFYCSKTIFYETFSVFSFILFESFWKSAL